VGTADEVVDFDDEVNEDRVEADADAIVDEDKGDEEGAEEVGMEESVVGISPVTVTNVPEAAGAFKNVAEERGRIVEAR
jgi:hypothetical protein